MDTGQMVALGNRRHLIFVIENVGRSIHPAVALRTGCRLIMGKKDVMTAIENKGIKPEDLREKRIAIEKVPSFLLAASGAGMTFVF